MVLRLDDTDVERNTEASVQSIFEGLRWLGSELGRRVQAVRTAWRCTAQRPKPSSPRASPIATSRPRTRAKDDAVRLRRAPGSSTPACAKCHAKRATAAPPRASRLRCAIACRAARIAVLRFTDGVYGEQSKLADEVEDFALLRSDGMPTYHLASCVDDADLRISHIIRGQDHLTNTFKHLLIFEALGAGGRPSSRIFRCWSRPMAPSCQSANTAPWSASPLIATPDSCPRLSSIFSACSAGRRRTIASSSPSTSSPRLFTLEGVNRANAVVNFTERRSLRSQGRVAECRAYSRAAGGAAQPRLRRSSTGRPACLARKAARRHAAHSRAHQVVARGVGAADFFFVDELAPYDPAELIPQKGRCGAWRARALKRPLEVLRDHGFRSRFARSGAARGRGFARPEGRADVPAHPGRRVRTQERAAAF